MTELSLEDIAELRKQGDFRAYLAQVAANAPAEPEPPAYTVTHKGGWPLGTAATGPTPDPTRCTCAKCKDIAPVIQLFAQAPGAVRHDEEIA